MSETCFCGPESVDPRCTVHCQAAIVEAESDLREALRLEREAHAATRQELEAEYELSPQRRQMQAELAQARREREETQTALERATHWQERWLDRAKKAEAERDAAIAYAEYECDVMRQRCEQLEGELGGMLSTYCLHLCYSHDSDADIKPEDHTKRCIEVRGLLGVYVCKQCGADTSTFDGHPDDHPCAGLADTLPDREKQSTEAAKLPEREAHEATKRELEREVNDRTYRDYGDRMKAERDEWKRRAEALGALPNIHARCHEERARWQKVTGYEDPESLDFFLGRMDIHAHAKVQGEIIAKAQAERDAAIARAEKAEKRVAEVEAIYASLNANLRKLGSGAPFLPAVEFAQAQHEADALRQRCERLEAFVQKVHDVPPIGVEEIRLMQAEARALLPEREGKTDE